MADDLPISRSLVPFFEERPYQVLFQDFRVFIQGVDVSSWITEALTITKTNRDGPGTASFTLDNALDRFVITEENLAGTWRDTNDRYSESAKLGIYNYKKGFKEPQQTEFHDLVKQIFRSQIEQYKEDADARIQNRIDRRNERNKKRSKDKRKDVGLKPINRTDSSLSKKERREINRATENTYRNLSADAIENRGPECIAAVEEAIAEETDNPKFAEKIAREQYIIVRTALAVAKAKAKRNKRPRGWGTPLEVDPNKNDPEKSGKHKAQALSRDPVDTDTNDSRFPLQARSIVFHKNDPVRIFIHNPLTERDEWMFGFTGFIDQYPVQTDYVTGKSTIQVQCYDIKALMQKMRITQNFILQTVAPEPLFRDRSSIFADMILNGPGQAQKFARTSFEDSMSFLTTGHSFDGRVSHAKFGVGNFSIGNKVVFPQENGSEDPTDPANIAILEEWHTLTLNGPPEDGNTIARLDLLTSEDVAKIGSHTTSDDLRYAPTKGKVHFLLPKKGTAARTLTQRTFDQGSEQRDWVTRFEVVTDFCAKLDYEWLVLPNGDMAFEFPMYDFLPKDFGDWQPVLEVDNHLINGGFDDEAGDIVTALIVSGGPETTDIDALGGAPKVFIPRGLIQCSLMASRVGVTVEEMSLPFVRKGQRLRSLGLIEFQKRLANANHINFDFGSRPFIMPNRPVLNKAEQRMALTSSVTETFQLFGVVSTNLNLRFVRQIREIDGKTSFRFITGGASMPISYRDIFPGDVQSAGNTTTTGVRAYPEFDGEDDALTEQEEQKRASDTTTAEPTNDDRPPYFVQEKRPGTFFALERKARRIAETIAETLESRGRPFELNNIPKANSRTFAVAAREQDGSRVYSDQERQSLADTAKENGYILVDTGNRFRFELRRVGQPDFIVRPDSG